MKALLLTILLFCGASSAISQYRVALNHLGTTTIFAGNQPFVDAYNASISGDTIYLPGSGLSVPPVINKRLVIIGAGIHLDSTQATTRTIIPGFSIGQDADKLHLEGLYINGTISFDSDMKIDSVVITRNYLAGGIDIGGANTTNLSNGILIKENYIVSAVNAQHTNALRITNNMLGSVVNLSNNAWISNNIFYSPGAYQFVNITESLIENNIIDIYYGFNNVYNSAFVNNVFSNNPTADITNTYLGNYVNTGVGSILINFQSNTAFTTGNYHLINPAAYLGTDGLQVGLFGGYSQMKEGAVPMNPHIMTKTIAPQTTPTGELNINITVGAQNN